MDTEDPLLARVPADLVDHVLDLLAVAAISPTRISEPQGDDPPRRDIHVRAEDLSRARATLDLVLPGLADSTDPTPRAAGGRLSDRLIRRSDWDEAPPTPPPADPAPRPPKGTLWDGRQAFIDSLGEAAGPAPRRPAAGDSGEHEDLDDFVPPEPPPIPTGSTARHLGWLGALGGPIVMLLSALLGGGSFPIAVGLAMFVGGFGLLVSQMEDRPRQDDGWDDGAVL